MVDELLETRDATQDDYDRAAWDHLNRLNAMTPEERKRYFVEDARMDWIITHPRPSTRCPTCGNTVLELKYSRDHIAWQCLEATCREFWEWRAK